jgi:hypothetical protein
MNALAVTAVTNFILASEVFLFAGVLLGRAAKPDTAFGFWALAMLFLGVGALLGGIDHGFFEPRGNFPARAVMQRATWITLGILTFFIVLTIGWQFAQPRHRTIFLVVALAQLALFVVFAILIDNFLVVILNYAPVMLLFLVLHLVHLGDGAGSWWMVIGLVLSFAASAIQSLAVDAFSPLDRNGLYHLIMMPAVFLLYRGGLDLTQG